MKTLFLPLLLLSTFPIFAQNSVERTPDGGGEYIIEKTACLSATDYTDIYAQLTANQAQLRAEGLLPEVNDRTAVAFIWPLQAGPGLTFNSFYGISNYVDQTVGTGILDYNCGNRSYEAHNGVDISTWPFAWYLMANNFVEVIAAADGVIIGKTDGYADKHCSCSGTWNAIYVQHADGSVAWYGHMKSGSLNPKTLGQTVSQGEYLGVAGSSGCSTGPHLHFEVYKTLPYQHSNLIEAFQGSCNALNAPSWWGSQQNYRVPTLNAITTHSAPPVLDCPANNEFPNFSDNFTAGTTAYFGTYYRDQLQGQVTSFKIRRPDNAIWKTWTHTGPETYNFSWWYFSWTLPAAGPYGTWTYEVTYQGETFSHSFTVMGVSGVDNADTKEANWGLAPNPTTGLVDVSGPKAGIEKVRVFDSWGKLLQVTAAFPVDLSTQPAGVYFFEITTRERVKRCKVLKV